MGYFWSTAWRSLKVYTGIDLYTECRNAIEVSKKQPESRKMLFLKIKVSAESRETVSRLSAALNEVISLAEGR